MKTIAENTKITKYGKEISLIGLSDEDSLRVQGASEFLIFIYKISKIYSVPFFITVGSIFGLVKKFKR